MVFIIQNRMSMNDYLYQYNKELNAEERQTSRNECRHLVLWIWVRMGVQRLIINGDIRWN